MTASVIDFVTRHSLRHKSGSRGMLAARTSTHRPAPANEHEQDRGGLAKEKPRLVDEPGLRGRYWPAKVQHQDRKTLWLTK
jgi:hypothetical protein